MKTVSSDFLKLHNDALVWDNHGCMPIRADDSYLHELERYRTAGVNVVVLNIGYGLVSRESQLEVVHYMRGWLASQPESYRVASGVDDIHRAKKEGALAIAFNIEGANVFENGIEDIQLFYDLGVRWMLLTYNKNNVFAGGCHDDDKGLTSCGRNLIDEMNRVGMVVCCSHMGHRSAMDVLDYSSQPVIFSHSNVAGLAKHPRNITDELIKACARKGGVIGINGVSIFLGKSPPDAEMLVRHIDYIVQMVGPRHAGVALDYAFDTKELADALTNAQKMFPAGQGYEKGVSILSPEEFPRVTESLLKMNYSEEHVRLILGENFLRIATEVWK